MSRLLRANFFRMVKNRMFWIGTVCMALIGTLLPFAHYQMMIKEDYPMYIDNGFFVGAVLIGILLAVFCSLFLGTEYHDGTIRNKIIVGRTRSAIYLANLITCIAAGFFMCAAQFILYLCAGLPLLGPFQMEPKTVLTLTLCVFLLAASLASIFTLVSMCCQNKALTAVICILTAVFFLLFGAYLQTKLNEPEIYSQYQYVNDNGEIETDEAAPNPHYIGGAKRKLYEFLFDFLPGGQALQFSNSDVKNPNLLMLYSGIMVVGTTGAGLAAFRKKNIN